MPQQKPQKIAFASLGCPKALVDSEKILTKLQQNGYGSSANYKDADLVIVNTCGFIDSAKRESLDTIAEAIRENGKVIVTGCLGAQSQYIKKRQPKVLAVTGPAKTDEVVALVKHFAPNASKHNPFIDLVPKQGIKLSPKHYGYIKISEGCNHSCSFCIIPSMRGRLVSRDANSIYSESQKLLESGMKELLIISQDTSAYGSDIKYRTSFADGLPIAAKLPELLTAIKQLDPNVWLRLHYVYPYPNVIKLVELMAQGIILPYLDVPLQHASLAILKRMRRPGTLEKMLETIENWRSICPAICIRSTFIVGFPGETAADFQILLDFLKQAQLNRVGVFQYSDVAGAASKQLADKIDSDTMQSRYHTIMQLQQQISANILQKQIAKKLEVVIDSIDDTTIYARSYMDAPEIDGLVLIDKFASARVGQRLSVTITASSEYDLYAKVNQWTIDN